MSRFSRRARGSTLVEVLIAGALLAIGMTAIAAMLNESVFSSRMASRKTEASEVGISQLERLSSLGYARLVPGIFDGGVFTDDAGTLLYQSIYVVDAGNVPAHSWYVSVQVTYWDNLRRPRTQTYDTVVSDPAQAP